MPVNGAGGSMESGAESNADLNALGSAINESFKDLEANPESGGAISVPGADDKEDGGDPPDKDTDTGDDSDSDDDEKSDDEAASAKEEAPPATPPPAATGKPGEPPSAPATPAKLKDLAGLDKNHLDAVRKFVPGNTLEGVTEEAYATAERAMVADYWRIQNENKRLSEERKAKGEDAPPSDPDASKKEETPAAPKEVADIIARKQEIATSDGPKALQQRDAWKAQADKLRGELDSLEASGTAEPDDIVAKHRAIRGAEKNSELWQQSYNRLAKEFRGLNSREAEVRLSLETRDRLDRREKKEAEEHSQKLSQDFLSDWNKTFDEVIAADPYIQTLDDEDRAAIRAKATAETYLEAGRRDGGIAAKDVKGFLSKIIGDDVARIKKAEERARKAIATAKAADAPKIPPQANRPHKPREKGSRTAEPSLRELENRINKHEAWDKV